MDIEKLKERIKQLQETITQSLANHHSLIGRLGEANYQLEELQKLKED